MQQRCLTQGLVAANVLHKKSAMRATAGILAPVLMANSVMTQLGSVERVVRLTMTVR